MKVSFDYDSTLSRIDIQNYAKFLVDSGYEVWCVTSRYDEEQPPKYKQKGIWVENDNSDLFKICDEIGIKKENIHFTNCADKAEFFENKDFLFHLDDDSYEISKILENKKCTVIGINCQSNSKEHWLNKCNMILISNALNYKKINKFEVIDYSMIGVGGRKLTRYLTEDESLEFSYQDDGKTLKIFI